MSATELAVPVACIVGRGRNTSARVFKKAIAPLRSSRYHSELQRNPQLRSPAVQGRKPCAASHRQVSPDSTTRMYEIEKYSSSVTLSHWVIGRLRLYQSMLSEPVAAHTSWWCSIWPSAVSR